LNALKKIEQSATERHSPRGLALIFFEREQKMSTEKTLLTAGELAERWGIAERTVYNKCCRSSKLSFPLKPIRIGRSVRFRVVDVEKAEQAMASAE
jgi:predicted DNA-binding transcriptional regulator AlpA